MLPKHSPWHSVAEDVHHDNVDCRAGASVKQEDLRAGTGGKPQCEECRRLAEAGR